MFPVYSMQWFREKVKIVSANQRSGRSTSFLVGLKNTNFEEDIDFLLPVKCRQIPFSVSEKNSQPMIGSIVPKTQKW